jgi:hypothetical protein
MHNRSPGYSVCPELGHDSEMTDIVNSVVPGVIGSNVRDRMIRVHLEMAIDTRDLSGNMHEA